MVPAILHQPQETSSLTVFMKKDEPIIIELKLITAYIRVKNHSGPGSPVPSEYLMVKQNSRKFGNRKSNILANI